MPSQLQSETARANGAKSHGPVTPEGRAISSGNSLRHGLRAKSILLPHESRQNFQTLLDAHIDQFQPQGGIEMELVETLAVTRWRLRRLVTIETRLLDIEMVLRKKYIDQELTDIDSDDRLAYTFQKLADHGQSLAQLVRYEGALNRSFDRAFKQLQILQSARQKAARLPSSHPQPTRNRPGAQWPGLGSFGRVPPEPPTARSPRIPEPESNPSSLVRIE